MASITEKNISELLKTQIKSSTEFNNLPTPVVNALNSAISSVVDNQSSSFINTVDTSANFELNNIGENLIGPTNPVDLVSSNLNPNQLKKNLAPELTSNTSPKLTASLVNSIFGQFKNNLPSTAIPGLNLDSVLGSLIGSTSKAVDVGLDSVLGSFANKTLQGNLPPPLVEDATSFFNTNGDGDAAIEQVDKQYSSIISNQALSEAKAFNIKSKENTEKLITQTKGFIDPSATHPTKEYQSESELNKLSRGDVKGTVVQLKEKNRTKGIKLPNEQSWEQPAVPFKGTYPFNKVYQTESGHIVEFDDTPGSDRIHIYHRSGTFVEIDSAGNMVRKVVGSNYEIIDKNGYISINGDASVSVKGSVKVYVGGDADIEVEGDTNIKCFNDITMQASGRVDISATEEINLHSANVNIEADVNLSLRGDVNAFLHSTDIYYKANNNTYAQTLNNSYTYVGNVAYLQTVDSYYVKSGSTIYNETYGSYNIKSIGNINQDGSQIWLNSDRAANSSDSLESKYSYSANIGLIGDRKPVIYSQIPDPKVPNYLDTESYIVEDSEDEGEVNKQRNRTRSLGITKDSELEESQVEIDKVMPNSTNFTVVMPDNSVLQQKYLPDNYQLSKHFTLGMLSSKAAVSNYKVKEQLGLSYGEIVFNLQGIALNGGEAIAGTRYLVYALVNGASSVLDY